jgi:hypothetical protein
LFPRKQGLVSPHETELSGDLLLFQLLVVAGYSGLLCSAASLALKEAGIDEDDIRTEEFAGYFENHR